MKLKDYLQKHGARKAAMALADYYCRRICGISLTELPDTAELCDLYDELEGILESNAGRLSDPAVMKTISSLIKDVINEDSIEELVLG